MADNKTCSVDILSVSLGEEGYLIIPRQTRELCEPLVKAADALERALEDLSVDEADKNRIARLSAELMAQAEQYAVELGIQAYLEFTRTLTPEMRVGLEGHKDNGVPETCSKANKKPPYLVATGKAAIGTGMICDAHSRFHNTIEQGV